MMKTILLITLSLVTAMKTEQLDCSIEEEQQISRCQRKIDGVERYTCEHLEAFINCIESINGNCAQDARIFLNDLDMSRGEIRSNETCYHQKFDQYFNQDGQCSFEDIRQVYKSVSQIPPPPQAPNFDDYGVDKYDYYLYARRLHECQTLQMVEDVIKQTKENCLRFFLDQISLMYAGYDPSATPECLKAYLPNVVGDEGDEGDDVDEDLPEDKPEFPTVNKLIQELVLIQKILSNKP